MATKKKPIHEIRFGAVRATIWTNGSQNGDLWYTVTTSRSYKDNEDRWQTMHSFKVQNLPDLARVIAAAHQWIEQRTMTPEAESMVRELVELASSSQPAARREQ